MNTTTMKENINVVNVNVNVKQTQKLKKAITNAVNMKQTQTKRKISKDATKRCNKKKRQAGAELGQAKYKIC